MTVLSPRLAPAALVLLLVAAAPVWFHAAVAPTHDDCADPAAFFSAPRIAGIDAGPLSPFGRHVTGAEGHRRGGDRVLSFRAIRSFDASRLYPRPVAFGFDTLLYLEDAGLRPIDAGDDRLPVHWSEREAQRLAFVEAYLYAQGGRPVRHPVWSGLALAWPQLVGGTRPITLLVVSGVAQREDVAALHRDVEQWLARAWQELEAACGP